MPMVGIVMGSDSDLKVMSSAAAMLEELGIEYEMRIISAHREPDLLIEWTRTAKDRGIKVMIAGAGMAAALPGMCAALFPLPVIGVPLSGKNLEGMDAVFSIMQMPPGIPVATVAIDGAKNAAILAAKMLATGDEELLAKIESYTGNLKKHTRFSLESWRFSPCLGVLTEYSAAGLAWAPDLKRGFSPWAPWGLP